MDISISDDTVALIDRFTSTERFEAEDYLDVLFSLDAAVRTARSRTDHGAYSVGGISTPSSAASVIRPAEVGARRSCDGACTGDPCVCDATCGCFTRAG